MRRAPCLLLIVACAPAASGPGSQAPQGVAAVEYQYPDIPAGATAERPVPVDTPDPPAQQLLATEAGMFKKGLHTNRTYYCVHPSGTTETVTTVLKTVDPQIDQIVRDTVAAWRFKPAIHQGQPTRACGRVEFNFKFG